MRQAAYSETTTRNNILVAIVHFEVEEQREITSAFVWLEETYGPCSPGHIRAPMQWCMDAWIKSITPIYTDPKTGSPEPYRAVRFWTFERHELTRHFVLVCDSAIAVAFKLRFM